MCRRSLVFGWHLPDLLHSLHNPAAARRPLPAERGARHPAGHGGPDQPQGAKRGRDGAFPGGENGPACRAPLADRQPDAALAAARRGRGVPAAVPAQPLQAGPGLPGRVLPHRLGAVPLPGAAFRAAPARGHGHPVEPHGALGRADRRAAGSHCRAAGGLAHPVLLLRGLAAGADGRRVLERAVFLVHAPPPVYDPRFSLQPDGFLFFRRLVRAGEVGRAGGGRHGGPGCLPLRQVHRRVHEC
mmetsp:Transcript_65299/g.174628  ORF Transcript_65299/g.174628 Transcript_65299/m.174628 type:complete len:243 (+) Transcript_65299:683-1411(+)